MQGNLADLGQMLMQGPFSVWIEQKNKKEKRLRDLRLKPSSRHVFLYERAIVFCKQKDSQQNGTENVSYAFKSMILVGK